MARTTFSGPVASDNGFIGAVTGNVTGNVTGGVTGAVAATTLTASGAVTLSNASVKLTALPTTNPAVAGALWNDGGTVKVSAG
jgi:hypothetical protein